MTDLETTRLKLALSGVMLPYMVMVCCVAILAGILNTHRHFAAPAIAPVLLNVLLIGSLCFGGWVLKAVSPRVQVFVAAVAVLLAGGVQLIIQVPPLHAHGVHIRPVWDVRSAAFRRVLMLMGPMILGLTATQLNTLADNLIAAVAVRLGRQGIHVLHLCSAGTSTIPSGKAPFRSCSTPSGSINSRSVFSASRWRQPSSP